MPGKQSPEEDISEWPSCYFSANNIVRGYADRGEQCPEWILELTPVSVGGRGPERDGSHGRYRPPDITLLPGGLGARKTASPPPLLIVSLASQVQDVSPHSELSPPHVEDIEERLHATRLVPVVTGVSFDTSRVKRRSGVLSRNDSGVTNSTMMQSLAGKSASTKASQRHSRCNTFWITYLSCQHNSIVFFVDAEKGEANWSLLGRLSNDNMKSLVVGYLVCLVESGNPYVQALQSLRHYFKVFTSSIPACLTSGYGKTDPYMGDVYKALNRKLLGSQFKQSMKRDKKGVGKPQVPDCVVMLHLRACMRKFNLVGCTIEEKMISLAMFLMFDKGKRSGVCVHNKGRHGCPDDSLFTEEAGVELGSSSDYNVIRAVDMLSVSGEGAELIQWDGFDLSHPPGSFLDPEEVMNICAIFRGDKTVTLKNRVALWRRRVAPPGGALKDCAWGSEATDWFISQLVSMCQQAHYQDRERDNLFSYYRRSGIVDTPTWTRKLITARQTAAMARSAMVAGGYSPVGIANHWARHKFVTIHADANGVGARNLAEMVKVTGEWARRSTVPGTVYTDATFTNSYSSFWLLEQGDMNNLEDEEFTHSFAVVDSIPEANLVDSVSVYDTDLQFPGGAEGPDDDGSSLESDEVCLDVVGLLYERDISAPYSPGKLPASAMNPIGIEIEALMTIPSQIPEQAAGVNEDGGQIDEATYLMLGEAIRRGDLELEPLDD